MPDPSDVKVEIQLQHAVGDSRSCDEQQQRPQQLPEQHPQQRSQQANGMNRTCEGLTVTETETPPLSPAREERRPLKVEFIGMDDMEKHRPNHTDASSDGGVGGDSKKMHHHHRKTGGARYCKPRMSLLGKPLNYRLHKRDARYRRVQAKIYNFLERPKDWRAISYHLLVFLMVFLCLLLSLFSTVHQYEAASGTLLYYLEIVMVLWFAMEYALRLWSAGCRFRYQDWLGRLRFARKPLCIVDLIVISASIIILCLGSSGQVFATSALRGLRFFQILRMVRVDRRGGSWKLLGSVVWAHRQELFTTMYIGFLGLIFSSFLVYLAEKEKNPRRFGTYADALWWGVITLCTVGYGDTVPITWAGKLIAAFCAVLGISFFALPAGILGSGFALKVQQQQRQKHLIRRRVPAALLIQSLWRCYAADENSMSIATWTIHMKPCRSPTTGRRTLRSSRTPPWSKMKEVFKWSFTVSSDDELSETEPEPEERDRFKHNSSFMSRLSTRRRDRHGTNSSTSGGSGGGGSPVFGRHAFVRRTNSQGDRESHRDRDLESGVDNGSTRSHLSLSVGDQMPLRKDASLTSLARKAESEDDIEEIERVTQLTEVHKKAIRALRKIKYFVARRRFKEAFRPYDVKDVIEQYSAGHIDMLARIKNLQGRLDMILGRTGSKRPDVYDSKISLASRVVKVERQVEDIETKLDILIDMYKEDRQVAQSMAAQSMQFPDDSYQYGGGGGGDGDGNPGCQTTQPSPACHRLQCIAQQKPQSEPNTPTVRNPSRPMHRNLSDLGPRIKKKVTYRCASTSSCNSGSLDMPPSILKKPTRNYLHPHRLSSQAAVFSERETSPDFAEGEEADDTNAKSSDNNSSGPILLRTERLSSNNSTESDCFSDGEETVDSTTDLLPQDGGAEPYKYHMRPESTALLMRPEVLKLRKTTC